MANAVVTSLGRVQPIYRGNYIHGTEYSLLDNVLYNGSTYVSLVDNNKNHYPSDTTYWQQIASRGLQGIQGYTGDFGTPTASAVALSPDANPTVSVTASGPSEAKVFDFRFGIPAGPYGFDDVDASVTGLPSDQDVTVDVELDTSSGERILRFDFGIPAANGQGAQSVDGIAADTNNNIPLSAVRYVNQNLSNIQKQIACNNINALIDPLNKEYDSFLYYGGNINNPSWITKKIQEVPSGGNIGALLGKNSNLDYDFIWIEPISLQDIDDIINA